MTPQIGYNWNGGSQMMNQMSFGNSTKPAQNADISSQTSQTLPGRAVKSIDEIKPFEVPIQNPGLGIFPKEDMSEIYVKYWTDSGIQSAVYTLNKPTEKVNPSDIYGLILDNLKAMGDRLDRIETEMKKRPQYHKNYNKNYKKPENINKNTGE